MDGRTLSRKLARVLREDPDTSGFVDPRTTFDLLFQAVAEYVARTQCIHSVDTVTTVAGTKDYLLSSDYLGMYMRDDDDYGFIRYTPLGLSTATNIRETTEAKAFENNLLANAAMPGGFYVTDYRTARANVTGNATATGSVSGGKTVLSGAGFTGAVSAGDVIHNTAKSSDGVVTSVLSNTQLNCALFGGTSQFFTNGEAYVIVPQGRFQLSLDSPPAATGDTIVIPYVKRPDPVYSDFESYNLPVQDDLPLVCYAAFLYKYRDQEPNFGDRYYLQWDRAVRLAGRQRNKAMGRTGWKAIFKK